MRFSDALLLGIAVVKETRISFLEFDNNNNPCGCALGTAAYANGRRKRFITDNDPDLLNMFPILRLPASKLEERFGVCPATFTVGGAISGMHASGKSRYKLAILVRELENKLEAENTVCQTLPALTSCR